MSEFDPTALSEIADILDEAGFVAKAEHARAALDEIERLQKQSMRDCISCRSEAYREGQEAQAKRIAEYHEHERQTHEILGAILGTDTSLEDAAKRAMKRIAELDSENAMHRTTIEAFKAQIIENSERMAELENPANVLYRLEKNLGEINADPLVVEAGKRIVELEEASAFECRDLYETIAKQRAALKILGKRSGKRGKALVEERAKRNKLEKGYDIAQVPDLWLEGARQQLRQEGLL